MAVIHYLGFCLIAVSLLPLGQTSLVYGSSDGGHTMHNSGEELNQVRPPPVILSSPQLTENGGGRAQAEPPRPCGWDGGFTKRTLVLWPWFGSLTSHSDHVNHISFQPGDIEGHRGSDGLYYVLDFARTFPPEARLLGDPHEKGAVLHKLLRPEFVRDNPKPLNSDAFTSAPFTELRFDESHHYFQCGPLRTQIGGSSLTM